MAKDTQKSQVSLSAFLKAEQEVKRGRPTLVGYAKSLSETSVLSKKRGLFIIQEDKRTSHRKLVWARKGNASDFVLGDQIRRRSLLLLKGHVEISLRTPWSEQETRIPSQLSLAVQEVKRG